MLRSQIQCLCSHRTQVRFEVGYYALKPDIKVIAPWREWDLLSRTKLIQYAEKNGIPVPAVSHDMRHTHTHTHTCAHAQR